MATDTKPIRDCLALLVCTFGGEVDSWQRRGYERTLKDIPPDVLLEAADLLIDEAAGGRRFYPLPTAPDVKGACAKVIEARRAKAWRLFTAECPHPQHFIEVTDAEGTVRSARCECWKAGRAAMEQAGAALALPAHTGDEL